MREIDDRVGPHARIAHEVAERGALEPRHDRWRHDLRERLFALGIDVEALIRPTHLYGFHLEALGIAVAISPYGDRRADGDGAFLQARFLGAIGRRQSDVPVMALGV